MQSFEPTTPLGQRSERSGRTVPAHIQASSPHYVTTRRHSLYGTEDRIILDPGSRVWKVGFSGEGRPRDVFVVGDNGASLWQLSNSLDTLERDEKERQLEVRMQHHLRSIFHDSLLTDPKSRKVILVENPLLPMSIKEMIARILFNNLQVPSISFAPSHLLSLLAVGLMSGLVLDSGHLESISLPITSSRPLYPYLRTTPLAGARINFHLRNLLILFGTYIPPPSTLSGAASITTKPRPERISEEILTVAVIEEIKTRCCFVGEPISLPGRSSTPLPPVGVFDDVMSVDASVSQSPSDSGPFRASKSDTARESHISSANQEATLLDHDSRIFSDHSQWIYKMFRRHSVATDIKFKVIPPSSQQTGTGRGTLIIPGWIRERVAECLFNGDVDESGMAQVILDSLLKVPRDLRKGLVSSILVVGGTAMLPGFIPRLHAELVKALTPRNDSEKEPGRRPYDPYVSLRPLLPYITILNNPSPPSTSTSKHNAGRAPAFTPATLSWVGGSLAGALKTGGDEILRERWDEAARGHEDPDSRMNMETGTFRSRHPRILPDWSLCPLPAGAPAAGVITRTQIIATT